MREVAVLADRPRHPKHDEARFEGIAHFLLFFLLPTFLLYDWLGV